MRMRWILFSYFSPNQNKEIVRCSHKICYDTMAAFSHKRENHHLKRIVFKRSTDINKSSKRVHKNIFWDILHL